MRTWDKFILTAGVVYIAIIVTKIYVHLHVGGS